MPKSKKSATVILSADQAPPRNTDSAGALPLSPEAVSADPHSARADHVNQMAAARPWNTDKSNEFAGEPEAGSTTDVQSPQATSSTLSEVSLTDKAGGVAEQGANRAIGSLDRVRVDSSGQQLTTNQGVPIADNQNSLKLGSRGPALLEDFILREKLTHFDHERIPERIVHARGSGAHGFFECYKPLTHLTKASLFSEAGKITPVFARFSTVQGERGSKDTARDTRGFAVKFYTDEGNWDLVGNNMPVFFIQDAMKFPDLVHAVKPEPHHQMPQAASAHDTFWDFVSLMPESTHMLMWQMSDRAIPRSYATMQGFGVHTFRLVNADGESVFVKFHWNPKAGTHSLVWDEAVKISGADPDFHRRDLWERIENGAFPEFELGIQVFTEEEAERFSFDVLDATKLVPEELIPVMPVGRMILNRNPDNFFAETEQVAFCTAHIVPGLDFSNDPLLAGRIHSYVDTQITRLGGPNFHEIPINAPLAAVHNNQRDGMHRQAIHRGKVAYEPNSLAGGCPFQAGAAHGFMSVSSRFESKQQQSKVRAKPEKFADHYTQATLFFESQSPIEQAHIAAAFRFELSKVTVPAIRERTVSMLRNASEELAKQVADGLGMPKLPPAMPKVLEVEVKPEVVASPALSLTARPGEQSIAGRKIAIVVADGIKGASALAVHAHLFSLGTVPRFIGSRIGPVTADDKTVIDADASSENSPGFLFDALVLPDGAEAVEALSKDGRVLEAIKDQYRHCKPILVMPASKGLLGAAGVPSDAEDSGLIFGDSQAAFKQFAKAIAGPRAFERETDPPLV